MPILNNLETELEEFMAQLSQSGVEVVPEEIAKKMAEFEAKLKQAEFLMDERDRQRTKESALAQTIERLESRTNDIRKEAQEYEATDLYQEAHEIYLAAERLGRELKDLKNALFDKRITQLPVLEGKTKKVQEQVDTLEENYQSLLAEHLRKEKEASIEDDYNDNVRPYLLLKRVAKHYLSKGTDECHFLEKRQTYLSLAQQILQKLPTAEQNQKELLTKWGYPDRLAQEFVADVKDMKENIRGQIQDIEHIRSEGIKDADIEGDELPLSYAIFSKWKKQDKDGFYRRLWLLNFLLLQNKSANTELYTKVRGLLSFINDAAPEKNAEKKLASEAKRFLMMAGNGVIKRFLEKNYNGLKSQEDYARLGQDLNNPSQELYIIQMAVNLPRLFDLGLNTRIDKIYEKRVQTKDVRQVTNYPDYRTTDDIEELDRVPGESLIPGLFEVELSEGELPIRIDQDKEETEVQVGQEETTEAQIYILDESGSMYSSGSGHRWLLRNAVFISALNTFTVDAAKKGLKKIKNLLFARSFDSYVTPLLTVSDESQSLGLLEDNLAKKPGGASTNLQLALETAYKDIKEAKGTTRGLREAKVVVVTDADQVSLNINTLTDAQKMGSTQMTTHVFSLEEEDAVLKELCRKSRTPDKRGNAFYYFIPKADAPQLAPKPPYGKAGEFSPVFPEIEFASEEEKNQFEARITELCKELSRFSEKDIKQKEEKGWNMARQLEKLLSSPPGNGQADIYEKGRTKEETEKRKRRTKRVKEIMLILRRLLNKDLMPSKIDMTPGDAMEVFKYLAGDRALLKRDYEAVCKKTGEPGLKSILAKYLHEDYPRLASI